MANNSKSTGKEPKKKNIEYIVTDYSVWNKFVGRLEGPPKNETKGKRHVKARA